MVCPRGHSFDYARSGYLNLLQPQDRRSKHPGDSVEAVAARRRYLDRGFAAALVDATVRALPLEASDSLLDVGCGEGHFLAAFRQAYGCEASGVDLSVPAIELAARRHRHCSWVVANADRLIPWADGSFTAVTSITARMNPEEFRRILTPRGRLLVVIPAADDLLELRGAVLGEELERDRVDRTVALFAPLFSLAKRQTLRQRVRLDREGLHDLMASSYRGVRTRERERLEQLDALDVTMSRDALLFV